MARCICVFVWLEEIDEFRHAFPTSFNRTISIFLLFSIPLPNLEKRVKNVFFWKSGRMVKIIIHAGRLILSKNTQYKVVHKRHNAKKRVIGRFEREFEKLFEIKGQL